MAAKGSLFRLRGRAQEAGRKVLREWDYLIRSGMETRQRFSMAANWWRSASCAIVPFGLDTAHMAATGGRPASLARSTADSACPA